jgi:hypothetical protein
MFPAAQVDDVETIVRWWPCTGGGSDAPAGAAVVPTGRDLNGNYSVAQPSADGVYCWIASRLGVSAGSSGVASIAAEPVDALYNPADGTPAVGDTWGAGSGSWSLRKNKPGFLVIGLPDTVRSLVPVVRAPLSSVVKAKGDIWTHDSAGDQKKVIGSTDGMLATVLASDPVGWIWALPSPAPGAPTSPSATPGNQQIQFTWSASTGSPPVRQYVVEYSTSSNMANPVQFAVTPNTSVSITGLTNGTTYYVAVYALGPVGSGASSFTSPVSATPTSAAPANTVLPVITGTPHTLTALTVSNGTWTNSPTSFTYQWQSGGVNVGTNANSYTIQNSDIGNTITCIVSAVNASGTTTATSAATGTVVAGSSWTRTANGTYTFTASFTGNHTISCWGAGASGAASGASGVPGGGGGEFRQSVVSLTSGNNYTVVVGAGGMPSANGGNSSFATTTVIANGGSAPIGANGGLGGLGGTGTVGYNGGLGAAGSGNAGGGGGSSAGYGAVGGNAPGQGSGIAPLGGGPGGVGGASTGANGGNGVGPGGGGGGAGATAPSSGNGADGQVIIAW